MSLWLKILIALPLGWFAGLILGPHAENLKPVGTMFINLVNMIIVMLVFSSMTVGVTTIHDPKKLGRVGIKTLGLYLVTTLISIGVGLGFALLFEPGAGLHLVRDTESLPTMSQSISLLEGIANIIPVNPLQSLVSGNVLQVIIFSIFLGLSINMAGERGRPLFELLESLAEVMYRLTSIVMQLSPFGVFAITAWVAGKYGLSCLPLAKFIGLYYIACLLYAGVVFSGILKLVGGLNPLPCFRGMIPAIMMALAQGLALPRCQSRCNVHKKIWECQRISSLLFCRWAAL